MIEIILFVLAFISCIIAIRLKEDKKDLIKENKNIEKLFYEYVCESEEKINQAYLNGRRDGVQACLEKSDEK
jgi:hypothetical protein